MHNISKNPAPEPSALPPRPALTETYGGDCIHPLDFKVYADEIECQLRAAQAPIAELNTRLAEAVALGNDNALERMRFEDHLRIAQNTIAELQGRAREMEDLAYRSERWRKAYQDGKQALYAMGGEFTDAAMKHLPCNEGQLDKDSRRLLIERFVAPHRERANAAESQVAEQGKRIAELEQRHEEALLLCTLVELADQAGNAARDSAALNAFNAEDRLEDWNEALLKVNKQIANIRTEAAAPTPDRDALVAALVQAEVELNNARLAHERVAGIAWPAMSGDEKDRSRDSFEAMGAAMKTIKAVLSSAAIARADEAPKEVK